MKNKVCENVIKVYEDLMGLMTAGLITKDRADQIREVFAEQHRPAGNRPREQVRDRLVVDFVSDERCAVEDTQDRHNEADVEQPNDQT